MEAKRRYYRMTDIADAADRKAATVRKHASDGLFNPESLRSVALYIASAVMAAESGGRDEDFRAQE